MPFQALIVDDDPSSRFIYSQVLANSGFELIEADDGVRALELLRTHTPKLIVLDMLLPRIQGTVVLDYIYNDPRLSDSHVIVVTAHDSYRDLLLRSGDSFLLKPVPPKDIRDAALRLVYSSSP
ncbi:MAG: response regulator [Aggregatilineales bacterium]